MKPKSHTNRTLFAFVVAALPCLGGCQGALVGNLLVLGVTVGIFFGTLGLGRTSQARSSITRDGSPSQSSRP